MFNDVAGIAIGALIYHSFLSPKFLCTIPIQFCNCTLKKVFPYHFYIHISIRIVQTTQQSPGPRDQTLNTASLDQRPYIIETKHSYTMPM